jgi:hypothetical protein
LVVFTISGLPFNAFHQHQDDLHRIAVISNEENHHCELDTYSCQDELLQNHECNHNNHIKESIPHCFFCQFHFNKTFEIDNRCVSIFIKPSKELFFQLYVDSISASFDSILNKGPPVYYS